jgi:crotonobetainyl-CoA:carnitine CoA-transferase CaiB-like acyl-CoA transferase
LRQLGIDAVQLVAANPQLTWISITGYGRLDPMANWVAFGDDAAVAAGLSRLVDDSGGEIAFCGDAVADPLTGLHAALLAWHGYRTGGGGLRALALRDVVAHCIEAELALPPERLRARADEWREVIERAGLLDVQPMARRASGVARALGADNGDF